MAQRHGGMKKEENMKYDVIVVGTGGTGTFFINAFSRVLAQKRGYCYNLYLVDGDTVEKKNLSRQTFQEEDVGRSKSIVMAEALNEVFGLNWKAVDQYVLNADQIHDLANSGYTPLVVGCVDNHACRLVLEEVFSKRKDMIYLDSANEYSSGEVVFAAKEGGKVLGPPRSHYFADILEGDKRAVTEMSCEELNNAEPQHIATNMLAANILLTEACRVLEGEKRYGFVSFDTDSFSSEFYPYTPQGVKA